MTAHIVVIGAGQAGVQTAEALRAGAALKAPSPCWVTSPMAPTTARRCPKPGWPVTSALSNW